jgi:hypothetical protein
MNRCPYNQTLCKQDVQENHRHICNGYEHCKVYQEITEHLIELIESGKLEEIMESEFDMGGLL